MLIQNWRDFATETIRVHDLDPTYDFLYAAKQEKGVEWASRFALHYLMFYDLGGAARCANSCDDDGFWDYITHGYFLFKRGTERRHSRGKLGETYVGNLRSKGTPTQILERMHMPIYADLVKKVDRDFKGCGFGPYFIWKVMDFQDRIFERPIRLNLEDALKYMPDEPRKCAASIWPNRSLKETLIKVTGHILHLPFQAPGVPNRPCQFAEAETVLCMLKGFFLTKSHTLGDDLASKHDSLKDFPDLLPLLPPQLDWSFYERPATMDPATVSGD